MELALALNREEEDYFQSRAPVGADQASQDEGGQVDMLGGMTSQGDEAQSPSEDDGGERGVIWDPPAADEVPVEHVPDELPHQRQESLNVTTLMVRNIACRFSAHHVRELLHDKGLHNYNFFYLPIRHGGRKGTNAGYFFINFTTVEEANRCQQLLDGKIFGKGVKRCKVDAAERQGVAELRAHFQNAAVMRTSARPLFL